MTDPRLLSLDCDVGGLSLEVISFVSREAISEAFEAKIVVQTQATSSELRETLLGSRATLGFGGKTGRQIHGFFTAVEAKGVSAQVAADASVVELTLSSKLSLLGLRKTSRVFQDKTAAEVVTTVLDEWRLPVRFALATPSPAWPYCVQHQESDLDFIRRVLAAEGWFFYFEDSGDADAIEPIRMVVGDSPTAYGVVAGGSAKDDEVEPVLRYSTRGQVAIEYPDRLYRFGERRSLVPANVLLRDASGHAQLDPTSRATVSGGKQPIDQAILGDLRGHYEFAPARVIGRGDHDASVALDQLRREACLFDGEAAATRLRPGFLFSTQLLPDASLDQAYVITQLETHGHDPRFGTHSDPETFTQSIRAVRSEVAFRPRRTHRAAHNALDTAVVVGPKDSVVSSDSQGRVKVRFHWDQDRPTVPDSREWDQRSTWLRVAQAWHGHGASAFFLPRVGSEVLVGYIGGDINRPVVIGSLPNSAAPPPFSLPADGGMSGIVTRSLGSDGQSELVFDDTSGRESARLGSQRKLELRAHQDIETRAGRNEWTDVNQTSTLKVKGERIEDIGVLRAVSVAGKSTLEVNESASVKVVGAASASLGSLDLHTRDDAHLASAGPLSITTSSRLKVAVEGLTSFEHKDTLFVSVGAGDAPAAHLLHVNGASNHQAKGPIEISSDQEVILRSGESTISVSPEAVQISAPKLRIDASIIEIVGDETHVDGNKFVRISGQKAFLLSSAGASVALGANAKVNGAQVQLGAPPDDNDGPGAKTNTPPPTRVKVVDQDGKPVVGERFLVRLSDGTTRGGITDEQGMATLPGLTGSATIDLIDLSDWKA